MHVVADVFAPAVADALMGVEQPVQSDVSAMLVGMERRADFHMPVDGAVQGVGGRVGDDPGFRPTALLAHPQHGSLADRAATGVQLLGLVLVGFLAANIHLVDFDEAAQDGRVIAAGFTEPLQHEPRALLRDPDLLGQLKAGNALAGRDQQIHGIEPLMERDMAPLEDGRGPDGEVRYAGVAAVEAVLAAGNPLRLVAAGADRAIRPALALHVDPRALRVGEHLEKLEGRDRGLAHQVRSETLSSALS